MADRPVIALYTARTATGLVLHDGRTVGTWKAKKAGKKLAVTATKISRSAPDLQDEAERLAAARGCGGASVTWA